VGGLAPGRETNKEEREARGKRRRCGNEFKIFYAVYTLYPSIHPSIHPHH